MIRRFRFTPEHIEDLHPNEVFVFGSNANGNHYGGAANLAYQRFGAVWGVGEGLRGNSYALPTLNRSMERVSVGTLKQAFKHLFSCHLFHILFPFRRLRCKLRVYPAPYRNASAISSFVSRTYPESSRIRSLSIRMIGTEMLKAYRVCSSRISKAAAMQRTPVSFSSLSRA